MDAIDRSIVAGVERQADRVVRTVSELIGFPSIVPVDPAKAGPAERDCQLYLESRLHDLGFRTDLWDPDGPALFEKYQGRPGAHAGRTFEGRPIWQAGCRAVAAGARSC